MKLLSKLARIRLADELWQSGDGFLLANITVTLGEEARSSSCTFSVSDPGLLIGGKFQQISFQAGGILVLPDLLQDPQPKGGQSTQSSRNSPATGVRATQVGIASIDSAFNGGAQSLIARAVGHSEGNRTVSGGFNASYQSHIDPGNQKRNIGSFSYQVDQGGASTPEQADHLWLNRLQGQVPAYVSAVRAAGLDPNDGRLLANFCDLYTQSPLAATGAGGFLERLKEVKARGATYDAILQARINSYRNPRTGALDAPGFGNDPGRLGADQRRRMDCLEAVLANYRGSAATPPAPQNMTPAAAPVTPALQQQAPPAESSSKGTEMIVELGFRPDRMMAFHFIHFSTRSDWGDQGHTTTLGGKSIRWLLTRQPQTRSFENMTLADVAASFTSGFGIKLNFDGFGQAYQHLDMTGCTPFELLQRECRAIGFRIADNRDSLLIEPAARPHFTNFVIDESIVISAQFNDQARAANTPNPNTITSQPAQSTTATPTTINRQTGQVQQDRPIDMTATATTSGTIPGAAAAPVTGTPQPRAGEASGRPPGMLSPGEQIRTGNQTIERGSITRTESSVSGNLTRQTTTVETATGTNHSTQLSAGQITELNRSTTAVNPNVLRTLDPSGAASPPTERDRFGLPKQPPGEIDLVDGKAEPVALVDESQRSKGFESSCVLMMTEETLQLVPGQIIGFSGRLWVEPFNREWRISSVTHDFGAGTTSLNFYTPQAPPPKQSGSSSGSSGTAPPLSTAVPSAGGWILPCSGRTGDGYGPRPNRPPGYRHRILDIAAAGGTPVLAMNNGVVADVVTGCRVGDTECGGGWGNFVLLQHDGGIFTRYCHLSSVTVQKGAQVKRGQVIGRVGNTGFSFGDHLHLDCRKGSGMGEIVLLSSLGLKVPEPHRPGFEY